MGEIIKKHRKKLYLIIVFLLILSLIQAFHVKQELLVSVLDIGQGDSILIKSPNYHNILIDAGPDNSVISALSKELGFFDKSIDLFILSHPHNDHYNGFFEVLDKYKVKKVILSGIYTEDKKYKYLLKKIKEKNIKIDIASSEKDIQISKNLFLDFIFPKKNEGLVGKKINNLNNSSVVLKLVRISDKLKKEPLFLFTGDAEKEEEFEILLSGQDISAKILKVGHHGSRTASSLVFLNAIKEKEAVISYGKDNKFNHPHAETLEKLKDIPVKNTVDFGNVSYKF